MNGSKLTEEEIKLLRQYQTLSTSVPRLINRLAVEIVPAVIFVLLWVYSGNDMPLIILICVMVIYNVQRVLRQYKNIARLNAISKKTIGDVNDEK